MQWIVSIMEGMGYWGILFLVMAENLFPPIPSEIILPLAGFLVAQGSFNLWGVVGSATAGAVLGALILYAAGRWFGMRRIYTAARRFGHYFAISEDRVQQSEHWFQKYGPWTVFFCRIVPVIRSLISIPAGLAKQNWTTFVFFTAAGTFLWNLALTMFGVSLGAAWPLVAEWVTYYERFLMVVVLIGLLLLFALRLRSR